jgi:hypothetical protein
MAPANLRLVKRFSHLEYFLDAWRKFYVWLHAWQYGHSIGHSLRTARICQDILVGQMDVLALQLCDQTWWANT